MRREYSPDLRLSQSPTDSAGIPPQGAPRPIDVAVAAVWRRVDRPDGSVIEVLAARRHAHAIRGGLWELPGGKIETGESPEEAARREVGEETGVRLEAVEPLGLVDHHDLSGDPTLRGEARVRLHAVLAKVGATIEAKPIASAECRWIPLEEFDRYAWPPANGPLNEMVKRALRARADDIAHSPDDAQA